MISARQTSTPARVQVFSPVSLRLLLQLFRGPECEDESNHSNAEEEDQGARHGLISFFPELMGDVSVNGNQYKTGYSVEKPHLGVGERSIDQYCHSNDG